MLCGAFVITSWMSADGSSRLNLPKHFIFSHLVNCAKSDTFFVRVVVVQLVYIHNNDEIKLVKDV